MTKVTNWEPTWESLRQYETAEWYQRDKFGVFIHWGLYCVPAFANEWYPRWMYQQGRPEFDHHVATYGPQSEFGYKEFIPLLTAERYDPAAWVDLFKRAGARFVVPVAEHHDGFCMYGTELTRWNAVNMGPHRDIVGELAAATRDAGLIFGLSSHRAEHWWFMNGGRHFDSDVQDPAFADFYGPAVVHTKSEDGQLDTEPWPDTAFLEDWLVRTCELVDKFRPQLVWFDWWIDHPAFEPYLQRFAAYYYNQALAWGKEVAINYKLDSFPEGTAVLDVERGQLKGIRPLFWQNDTSVSKNSWGYIHDHDYKSASALVHDLCDVVSKNGALLLNVGPRADGTIPVPEQELLLAMGDWLAVNGEAIYGSGTWDIFGEGPTELLEGHFTDTKRNDYTTEDFRFTTQPGALYAICLGQPSGSVTIASMGAGSTLRADAIASITLLGDDGPLAWSQDAAGLTITLPDRLPCAHAVTFKIALLA